MKLWLLSQSEQCGYDTFDSMVVAAETEADARKMHPTETWRHTHDRTLYNYWKNSDCWAATPEGVEVEYLGIAEEGTEPRVILASYNAG
jgi:hypothetical protein